MNKKLNTNLTTLKSIIEGIRIDNPIEVETIIPKQFVEDHKFLLRCNEEEAIWLTDSLEDYLGGVIETKVISKHKPGWVKKSISEGNYDSDFWSRFSEYLLKDDANFPVPSLDKSTSKILDYIHDPMDPGEWCRKGMVVGHVQSGKTSNYTGLINKAIGHGYKLIIVLTGMFDDLRIQTQERIDYGVIGKLSANGLGLNKGQKVGVGNSSFLPKTNVISLTSIAAGPSGDFNSSSAPNVSESKNDGPTYIISIKKNKAPLEEVVNWLSSLVENFEINNKVKNLPTLIIDDEADSASVNTSKEGEDPKTINRYIRVILNMLEKVSYVGYTATPYANIFIESSDKKKTISYKGLDYDISKDLFPSDFIINLQAPKNYFGPHKVFSKSYSKYLVKILERYNDNYRITFPPSIKTITKLPDKLIPSLKDAIRHFILTTIIREHRDHGKSHNSMLVHVSLRVMWIDRVARLIDDYLRILIKDIIARDSKVYDDFKNSYNDIINSSKELKEPFNPNLNFLSYDEVWERLIDAIEYTQVVSVHGNKSTMHLEHEITSFVYSDIPRYYICVGGNRLSRGITLQGLTTSYFIRVSRMYDSLMQMGRWFGYRKNYADLCRLYTSSELSSWYTFITEATEELRDEFNNLDHNTTPSTYSLKVRESPDMLKITSLGKMRYSERRLASFDGSSPTLRQFDLNEKIHNKNKNLLLETLSSLKGFYEDNTYKSKLWVGQENNTIVEILNNISVSAQEKHRHALLVDYIIKNKKLYDSNWNILLFSNSRKAGYSNSILKIKNVEHKIYGVQRKHDSLETSTFKLSKDSLTSGNDKTLDLRITLDKSLTIKQANELRAKENTPLLMLYLIDGYKSLGGNRKNESDFDIEVYDSDLSKKGVLIPSYFIVFPGDIKNQVEKVNYISNLVDQNLEFQDSDDEE